MVFFCIVLLSLFQWGNAVYFSEGGVNFSGRGRTYFILLGGESGLSNIIFFYM